MNWNPPSWVTLTFFLKFFTDQHFFFQEQKKFSKEQLLFSFLCIVKQKKILERSEIFWNFLFLKIYFIKMVWKGGFQLMLILGLLGMYFEVVFVTSTSKANIQGKIMKIYIYPQLCWGFCECFYKKDFLLIKKVPNWKSQEHFCYISFLKLGLHIGIFF